MKPERSGPWVAVVGLVVMVWLVVSTVLYAPWWGVLAHAAVLVCFVPVLRRWIRARPAWSPVVAVMAFAAWCAVNAVGVLLLGWRTD